MRRDVICALIALALPVTGGADDVREVALPTKDILYDAVTKKIYASVPGTGGARANSITTIDPVTGAIGPSVFIGSEPGKLALSDRSKYLWVVLDGSNSVRRFDLATQTAGLQISLGAATRAQDIAAVPGDPEALLVVRTGTDYTVAMYKDGKLMPKPAPGGNTIVVSPFAKRVYGYRNEDSSFELTTMDLTSEGVERRKYRAGVIEGGPGIGIENGVIYTTHGSVYDPETYQRLGEYHRTDPDTYFAIDAAAARMYSLYGRLLRVFDLHTFQELGSQTLTGTRGGVMKMIRWGADGLAFSSRDGYVYLIRSKLVGGPRPPVDLTITRSALPTVLKSGRQATYTLTVKNAGSVPATGVFLTDDLGDLLNVLDCKSSQGHTAAVEGVLRADLGRLAAGASTTVTVRVRPAKEGVLAQTAIVRCREVDTVPANNAAVHRMRVGSGPHPAAPGIDLTGAWISLNHTVRGAGVDLQATLEGVFTVRNAGRGKAASTKVRFLRSYRVGPTVHEDLLQEVDVPALAPGKSFQARLRAKLAKGTSALGDVVIAVVDPAKVMADANPGNNTVRSKPIP